MLGLIVFHDSTKDVLSLGFTDLKDISLFRHSNLFEIILCEVIIGVLS